MVGKNEPQLHPVTLNSMDELSPGIFLLSFPRDFDFLAGQVIGIAMDEKGPRRLYSICSGTQQEEIQVLFNVVEEGYLTPRLCDLHAGDQIWITAPRGEFLCPEKEAVWIAAGTGIAPFLSMLRSDQGAGKILLHGERTLEQFHYTGEFRSQANLQYIPCCSGENPEGMYHGRVTSYLEKEPLPASDSKYYLCGSAEMVVDTRDILIEKGVPFDSILSEIYF